MATYEESLAVMYRERLTNFYKAYAPEKVSEVDSFLTKYAGKEENLFRALVKKYGPEPEPDDDDDDDDEEDEEEVVGSSGGANPNAASKTSSSASLTEVVESVEDEPCKKLSYEESLAVMYRERLTNFYNTYAPEKVSEVDSFLTKYSGKEENLFRALVKKYGPEPEESDEGRFGDEGGLQEYPEVIGDGDSAQPKKTPEVSAKSPKKQKKKKSKKKVVKVVQPVDEMTFEERLTNFYTKYEPAKLGNIAKIMHKYAGAEEKLFETLVKKYGKEPKVVKYVEVEEEEEDDDDDGGEEDGDEKEGAVCEGDKGSGGDDDDNDEEEEEEDDDDDEEEEEVSKSTGLFLPVKYCGVCGLPPEYCKWGPAEEEKCNAWLEEFHLGFFGGNDAIATDLSSAVENIDLEASGSKKSKKNKRGGTALAKKAVVDPKKQKVSITFSSRGGKKIVTHVVGLQYFEGVTLGKELTKALGKRFACATSIKDTPAGEKEVQIQGDVRHEIEDVLQSLCGIPKSKVTVDSGDGKKVKKPKEIAPQQRPMDA